MLAISFLAALSSFFGHIDFSSLASAFGTGMHTMAGYGGEVAG